MQKRILVVLSLIRPEINFLESTNYIDDGFLDSFDIVQLVVELEEEFKVSINGTEIVPEHFSSLENIERLLIRKSKLL